MGLMDEVEAFHIVNSPEFTTSKVMLSKIDSKCRKFPCSFQETGILESYMNTISICTIYDTYVPWKISLTTVYIESCYYSSNFLLDEREKVEI